MPTRRDDAPLIVTARLDPVSFAILDDLRRRYFPPALNKVPAHISLFHHLPGVEVDRALADAMAICAGYESFELVPTGPRFLGRGVALGYEAAELHRLRATLAGTWAMWLTAQDRQPFKPHVTVQNKVAPDVARRLFEEMRAEASPACRVEGVAVWRYLGGPWEAVTEILFPDVAQYGATTG